MSNNSKSKTDRLAEWLEQIVSTGASLDDLARNSVEHFDAQPNNPLVRAAEYFGLDTSKPTHRDLLLHILAEVCFRAPGRPSWARDWTVGRYVLLGQHLAEVSKAGDTLSDAKAAAQIKETFPADYGHVQADAIRKRLPEARLAYSRARAGK